MARIIVCTMGFFVFGIIYAEILNAFLQNFFRVNACVIGASAAFVYLFIEWVLTHFEKRASLSTHHDIRFRKIKQYYYICLAFFGFILLLAAPFIWWGAIKRLAEQANEGIL